MAVTDEGEVFQKGGEMTGIKKNRLYRKDGGNKI